MAQKKKAQAAKKTTAILPKKMPNMPEGAKMPKIIDVKPVERIFMTPEEWFNVPDNPIQKEKRASRPNIGHLRKFVEEHASVRLGVLPNGAQFKIEGHTRSRIWKFAPWLVDFIPSQLTVDVYPCKNFKEAAERFRRVDNPAAVKNATDEVHGSFKLMRVATKSKFFQNASNIKSPLGYAFECLYKALFDETTNYKDHSIDEMVDAFKDALNALDGINVNRNLMPAPFVMAFLLAYTKHGNDIVPFFEKINAGTYGRRDGKKHCCIAKTEKAREDHSGGGKKQHLALASQVLGALDKYMEGDYKNPDYVPPISIERIIAVDLNAYLTREKSRRTGRTVGKNITR